MASMRVAARIVLALTAVSVLAGCPYDEWLTFRTTRFEYLRCAAARDNSSFCEAERKASETAYDKYEAEAVDSWGCEYTPDGCNSSGFADERRNAIQPEFGSLRAGWSSGHLKGNRDPI